MELSPFVDAIKLILRARYAFAAWVTCGLILLGKRFGVADFPDSTAIWISGFGLFSFVVWVVELSLLGWDYRKQASTKLGEANAKTDEINQYLDTLRKDELDIIAIMLAQNTQTAMRNEKDTAASSLIYKGLLVALDKERFGQGFVAPSSVWKILQLRRNELIEKAQAANPDRKYLKDKQKSPAIVSEAKV